MENQKKKLRLDELKVESFVTSLAPLNSVFAGEEGTYGQGCPNQTDFSCQTYNLFCLTRQNWCGIPTINDNCFTKDPKKECNDIT